VFGHLPITTVPSISCATRLFGKKAHAHFQIKLSSKLETGKNKTTDVTYILTPLHFICKISHLWLSRHRFTPHFGGLSFKCPTYACPVLNIPWQKKKNISPPRTALHHLASLYCLMALTGAVVLCGGRVNVTDWPCGRPVAFPAWNCCNCWSWNTWNDSKVTGQ
jgi:hypothetical protein